MTLEQAKNYKSLVISLVVGNCSRCWNSYAATKDPLKPWVLIKCSGAVLVGHCTCMARLAETYSHVGAILHWVEAAVRIQKNVACTSKENRWIVPTPKENIPYLKLREINFRALKLSSPSGFISSSVS